MSDHYWVLICGSRGWHDDIAIEGVINRLVGQHGQRLVIVHGGAKGADEIAGFEARIAGIKTVVEKADWKQFGKGAGPIRNQAMLDKHPIAEVHAFRSTGKSSGTDDMVSRARKAEITTYVHHPTYTVEYLYSPEPPFDLDGFQPVTPEEVEEVRTSIQNEAREAR